MVRKKIFESLPLTRQGDKVFRIRSKRRDRGAVPRRIRRIFARMR